MPKLAGCSLIACQPAEPPPAGRRFRAANPATGASLAPDYIEAAAVQVDQAVGASARAFDAFRGAAPTVRADLLARIADELESRVEEFVARTPLETAYPEARVRGELARTVGQLRMFAGVAREGSWVDARIDPGDPDRKPLPRPDCRSMLRPLGPVAVFGASNFPLAFSVAGGDAASALAAGCPVVVKAHSAHPGTSEIAGQAIAAAIEASDLPPGVFSLLYGAGETVGVRLVQHPLIKAVGFTGSFYAGTTLYDLAVSRDEPIPVYAEMSSVNPVFLLPEALATRGKEIAAGLFNSATLGVGQFCTNPGVVVHGGDTGFSEQLRSLFADAEAGCMLTQPIAENYEHAFGELCSHPRVEAARRGPTPEQPCHVRPGLAKTTVAALMDDSSLLGEVFGPSTLVARYEHPSELLELVERLPGQLTASVHGTRGDLSQHAALLRRLELVAGRLILNQFPTGVEVGHAMVHGGPYPATTDSRTTSVGASAIRRFARPVCFQNYDDALLPPELQESNPLKISRLVDGVVTIP